MSSHTWLIENAIFCLFFSGFPYRMGKYTEDLDWGMNIVSCMKAKTSPTTSRLVQSSLGLELLKNGPVAVSLKSISTCSITEVEYTIRQVSSETQ